MSKVRSLLYTTSLAYPDLTNPPLRRIPSLYYKLEEEDLMSAYICSPDSSHGMHKCRDLPSYKAGNTQEQSYLISC